MRRDSRCKKEAPAKKFGSLSILKLFSLYFCNTGLGSPGYYCRRRHYWACSLTRFTHDAASAPRPPLSAHSHSSLEPMRNDRTETKPQPSLPERTPCVLFVPFIIVAQGLTQAVVSNQEGINCLMDQGQKMRTVGATAMNETSSRSHSIFTIVVEMNDVDEAGKDHIRVGKASSAIRNKMTGCGRDKPFLVFQRKCFVLP